MAEVITLKKGQRIDVGLTKISIGLGWDPNESNGYKYDLDASVFMLDINKKIPTANNFIFYGNLCSPCRSVIHTGDDETGENSKDGDDENIKVDFSKIPTNIIEILIVVSIYEHQERKQNFGQVRNAYIRIVDDNTDTEIAKYELDEDFSTESALEFGRLYKRDNKWKFEASGFGYKEDLAFFVKKYSSNITIK